MSPTPQPRSASGGWIKAPSSLVFSLPPELLATWLRIQYYDRGQGCWASMATIAAGVVGDRQVRRHVRELERRGLVRVVARESQTSVIYCIEPQSGPEGVTSAKAVRSQKPPSPLDTRANQEQIHEQEDHMKHNQDEAGAEPALAVVVHSHEAGDLLSLHLPADLEELPRKRRGISTATIRKLVGEHGVDSVRQAVAVLNRQYPTDEKVRSFGALLSVAVSNGWKASTPGADREARQQAIAMATPPAETRWAKPREGGEAVEVLEVNRDVVRTASGVIPAHMWPSWTWLETIDAEPNAHKAQEGPRNVERVLPDPTIEGESLGEAEKVTTLRAMYAKPFPALKRMAVRLATDWNVPLEIFASPVLV